MVFSVVAVAEEAGTGGTRRVPVVPVASATKQVLDSHLRSAVHLQPPLPATRAGVDPRRERHRLGAVEAPRGARQLVDRERRPLGDAALHDGVEAEAQRLDLYRRELPDLETHFLHPPQPLAARAFLDDAEHAFG